MQHNHKIQQKILKNNLAKTKQQYLVNKKGDSTQRLRVCIQVPRLHNQMTKYSRIPLKNKRQSFLLSRYNLMNSLVHKRLIVKTKQLQIPLPSNQSLINQFKIPQEICEVCQASWCVVQGPGFVNLFIHISDLSVN